MTGRLRPGIPVGTDGIERAPIVADAAAIVMAEIRQRRTSEAPRERHSGASDARRDALASFRRSGRNIAARLSNRVPASRLARGHSGCGFW
jgi:hypothetical protein